jgi:hypothetical protein
MQTSIRQVTRSSRFPAGRIVISKPALSSIAAAAMLALAALPGCVIEAGHDYGAIASSEDELRTDNGLNVKNGLLFDNGLRLKNGMSLSQGLATGQGLSIAHGLATEQGLSSTTGFLTSEAGQELITYMVECALPLGRSITKSDPVHGGFITFDGYVGLAPQWETGACGEDCQQWVTACLLARSNALGQTRSIEMVASHPAIGSRRTQPFIYLFEEAAFHGNIFQNPPQSHACLGSGGVLSALQTRLCGLLPWLTCGFDSLLDTCFLLNECTGRDGDAYVGCRDHAGTPEHTITTYTRLL